MIHKSNNVIFIVSPSEVKYHDSCFTADDRFGPSGFADAAVCEALSDKQFHARSLL